MTYRLIFEASMWYLAIIYNIPATVMIDYLFTSHTELRHSRFLTLMSSLCNFPFLNCNSILNIMHLL